MPSMIQDMPLKIKSMPMNRPMTQKAVSGKCRQMKMPRNKVMKPLIMTQGQPWKYSTAAPTMRMMPPTMKAAGT